jgi:hypothetical protein
MMSMRYFMIFGSPAGRRQVKGPARCGHHSGWIELDHYVWAPGLQRPQMEMGITVKEDAVSPRHDLIAAIDEIFDVVVLDLWDDSAQVSKGKVEFYRVMIASYQRLPADGPPSYIVVLNYVSEKVSPGAATKTAGIGPAATKIALASVPRRTPMTAARG